MADSPYRDHVMAAMTRVYNIQKCIFLIPGCVFESKYRFDQQNIGFGKILECEKSTEKLLYVSRAVI